MKNKIPITVLCRMRNESLVLPDYLDHIDKFADEFYFFDDCSTDNSVEIVSKHPKTKKVLRNHFHNPLQTLVQTAQRKCLLDYARVHSKNKWFALVEPDERVVFDFSLLNKWDKDGIDIVYFRLLDSYITKGDKKPYKKGDKLEDLRKWFGPEYRFMCFLYKKDHADFDLKIPSCRQPQVSGKGTVGGFIKHYGKSISIDQWEETCRYYMKSVPVLADKWEKRLGKGIHTKSDFDRKLLTWEQIESGKHELVKI